MTTAKPTAAAAAPPLRAALFDALEGALQEDRAEKARMCRVLMRLCAIDGALHPAERTVLEGTMDRHGLAPDERARIWAELGALLGGSAEPAAVAAAAEPLDVLLAPLSRAALTELLVHLEHGAWADGVVVPAEHGLLEAVRARLQGTPG